jgi:hypothetical protein
MDGRLCQLGFIVIFKNTNEIWLKQVKVIPNPYRNILYTCQFLVSYSLCTVLEVLVAFIEELWTHGL